MLINDENLKNMIEQEIGNDDPYYCEPAFNIIKKLIKMDYMQETSVAELAKEFNYDNMQLFELYRNSVEGM